MMIARGRKTITSYAKLVKYGTGVRSFSDVKKEEVKKEMTVEEYEAAGLSSSKDMTIAEQHAAGIIKVEKYRKFIQQSSKFVRSV
jgi:predicted CopG family antitoxin